MPLSGTGTFDTSHLLDGPLLSDKHSLIISSTKAPTCRFDLKQKSGAIKIKCLENFWSVEESSSIQRWSATFVPNFACTIEYIFTNKICIVHLFFKTRWQTAILLLAEGEIQRSEQQPRKIIDWTLRRLWTSCWVILYSNSVTVPVGTCWGLFKSRL